MLYSWVEPGGFLLFFIFFKILKILKHEGVRTRMEGKVSRRLFNIRTRESRKRGDSRCSLSVESEGTRK